VTTSSDETTNRTTTVTSPPAPSTADDWPADTKAWAVVLASKQTRGQAELQASRASGLGSSGVLNSTNYVSLRPGYWVAYAGPFHSRELAQAETNRYRRNGFADAYPRYVSADG
jgi:hypothetical protein